MCNQRSLTRSPLPPLVAALTLSVPVCAAPQQKPDAHKSFWDLIYLAFNSITGGWVLFILCVFVTVVGVIAVILAIAAKRGSDISFLGIRVGSKPKDEVGLLAEIAKRDGMLAFMQDTTAQAARLLLVQSRDGQDEFCQHLHVFLQDRLGMLTQAMSGATGTFRRASIMHVFEDPDGALRLGFIAAVGLDDDSRRAFMPEVAPGSIAGEAAYMKRTINVDDVLQDERYRPVKNRPSYRSLLCVPILDTTGEALGVVNVDGQHVRVFRRDDEVFVEAFSTVVALVFEAVGSMRNYEHVTRLLPRPKLV